MLCKIKRTKQSARKIALLFINFQNLSYTPVGILWTVD